MEKPFNSSIQVTKSQDFFEAYMPRYFMRSSSYSGAFFGALIMLPIALFSIAGSYSGFFLIFKDGVRLSFILMTLFFLTVFFLSILYIYSMMVLTIHPMLTKRYLRISGGQILLAKAFIWQNRNKVVCSFQIEEIYKIFFAREHFYKNNDGDREKREANLTISFASRITEEQRLKLSKFTLLKVFYDENNVARLFKKFIIFDNENRRDAVKANAELAWLAYEISEWLDKPLTILEPAEL